MRKVSGISWVILQKILSRYGDRVHFSQIHDELWVKNAGKVSKYPIVRTRRWS